MLTSFSLSTFIFFYLHFAINFSFFFFFYFNSVGPGVDGEGSRKEESLESMDGIVRLTLNCLFWLLKNLNADFFIDFLGDSLTHPLGGHFAHSILLRTLRTCLS